MPSRRKRADSIGGGPEYKSAQTSFPISPKWYPIELDDISYYSRLVLIRLRSKLPLIVFVFDVEERKLTTSMGAQFSDSEVL
jgi:hypothetical protein